MNLDFKGDFGYTFGFFPVEFGIHKYQFIKMESKENVNRAFNLINACKIRHSNPEELMAYAIAIWRGKLSYGYPIKIKNAKNVLQYELNEAKRTTTYSLANIFKSKKYYYKDDLATFIEYMCIINNVEYELITEKHWYPDGMSKKGYYIVNEVIGLKVKFSDGKFHEIEFVDPKNNLITDPKLLEDEVLDYYSLGYKPSVSEMKRNKELRAKWKETKEQLRPRVQKIIKDSDRVWANIKNAVK